LVKNTFSQRLRGSSESSLPQDIIAIFLSDQRLQFVVADHLGQPHLLRVFRSNGAGKAIDLLKLVFSQDADIRKSYRNAHIILNEPVALLEPLSLNEDESDLTKYLIPKTELNTTLSDRIDAGGIKVIYSFDMVSKSTMEQMFPNLRFHHHHTLFIELFEKHVSHLPGDRVFIHLDISSMSIIYFKDARLQYCNQFSVRSDDDRIYYLMLIYQQFDLDPSRVPLSVSLGGNKPSKVLEQIRAYVQNIQLMEYQPNMKPSESVHQESSTYQNYYFPLSAIGVLTAQ